jgi:hypothetical protein
MMENSKPLKQHLWLQKLVGDWRSEGEMPGEPGQPPSVWKSEESVRAVGAVWVQGEARSQMPDGSPSTMLITLGYDPQKQRFVGTWLGTMMTNLWVYSGWLDESEKVLTLEADGPGFEDPTKTETYRDVIEFKTDDYRTLTAQRKGEDGTWQPFMTAHYRRNTAING